MPDTEERLNNYLLNKQKYRNLNKRKKHLTLTEKSLLFHGQIQSLFGLIHI